MGTVIKMHDDCVSVELSPDGILVELVNGTERNAPHIEIDIRTWPHVVAAVEREMDERKARAVAFNLAHPCDE